MATVTIRNLEERIVKELKKQAKDNKRSLEAELRHLLSETVEQRLRQQAFMKEAARIRRMTPKDRRQSDSTELLREDRRR